jgi:hypothetical protein
MVKRIVASVTTADDFVKKMDKAKLEQFDSSYFFKG